ncbi:MAG: hypothetical protein PVI97_07860 [Candidatus Thiodiazotropha sp.]|jgi:hypothetical protein
MKLVKGKFISNYVIVCFTILLCGCNDSSNNLTELEGEWQSTCSNGSFEINGEMYIFSGYQILTINKTTVMRTSYSYSGEDCDDTRIPDITEEYSTILIGDSVKTINGLTAKEIDFIYEDRESSDIYFLLNKSSTLYFGKKYGDNYFVGMRPKELNYYIQFNKHSN